MEPVKPIGDCSDEKSGTKTTFRFDTEIFKGDLDFNFNTLIQRFREMAFVTRKVKILLSDERGGDFGSPVHQMTFYLRRRDHLFRALPQPQPARAAPGDVRSKRCGRDRD